MRRLTARVLWSGGLSGAAAGLAFFLARRSMPRWFTSDPAVVEALLSGGVWTVLAAAQPLNGLLFVFDGLMYATQVRRPGRNKRALGFLAELGMPLAPASTHRCCAPRAVSPHVFPPSLLLLLLPLLLLQAFRYVRDYMALGFALVFLPALAIEAFVAPSLANIWLAKAALNVWRLAGAAHLIYWRFLPRFGLDKRERQGAAGEADAAAAAAQDPAAHVERRPDDGP